MKIYRVKKLGKNKFRVDKLAWFLWIIPIYWKKRIEVDYEASSLIPWKIRVPKYFNHYSEAMAYINFMKHGKKIKPGKF